MATYLVTGVARGLGLEIVRVLASKPASEVSTVFATLRSSPPPALQEIVAQSEDRVVLVNLEVTKSDSIATAVRQVSESLAGRGLDILINNAAVSAEAPGGLETMDNLRPILEVNVESVHNITVAFLPLLREGRRKIVLNMYAFRKLARQHANECCRSSITGSMAHAERFMIAPYHGYKISKAALNCMTRLYALDMDKEGFTFFAVSPGVRLRPAM
jgi:NAD(P)-dependent dehydrogenase (short-subunit alcohol dehydrogenase family)